MSTRQNLVGTAQRRVDGRAKVTGVARYAAEFAATDLLHGAVVSSAIAKGKIKRIDAKAAAAVPGVVKVYTHENRPRTAWFDSAYQDEVAPPGHPFRALYSDTIMFSGQPVALVVADDFETATYAASLVEVTYDAEAPNTDLDAERPRAYVPPKKRSGIEPPPKPRGHAEKAYAAAPVKVQQEYRVGVEHHNPMEPHATTVVWEGDGRITVHDKIQGVTNTQGYLKGVFGLSDDKVRVVSPFIGGAFGAGLRPQYQLFLAVLASLDQKRSVRVVLTRDQMFTFGHRPLAIQTVSLGAGTDGVLTSIMHDSIQETSTFEDYQENQVNWSGLLYKCDNTKLTYELAKLDTYTPADMRAPGAVLGLFALEAAMDELAVATGVDPVELRLRNYIADVDQNTGKALTSKALRDCYLQGAERFGWSKRDARPRSMRDGRELVGWGMATGVWEAMMQKTSARATLTADGRLEVATASADIGTGTYTILTQLGADALGLGMDDVTAKLGDSTLPYSPLEGGSWTAASAGTAVQMACETVREQVFKLARQLDGSPLANQDLDHVTFRTVASRHQRSVTLGIADRRHPVFEDRQGRGRGNCGAFGRAGQALRLLHAQCSLRGGEDRRGAGCRPRHARGQCGCGRQNPEPPNGAQPDPRRRRDGDRLGFARGIDARPQPRPLHEPQSGRVSCPGSRRHLEHRRYLRRRAGRQGKPYRREGPRRDRHRGYGSRSRQCHLSRDRQACP